MRSKGIARRRVTSAAEQADRAEASQRARPTLGAHATDTVKGGRCNEPLHVCLKETTHVPG